MKFLSHSSIFICASAAVVIYLALYARKAKKLAKKLRGSGRVTDIRKWENRTEFSYMGISIFALITILLAIIRFK
jgi:hypothetical protein